jgi:hypothetical protein
MQIDCNSSQPLQANRPIDRRFESNSNSTVRNPVCEEQQNGRGSSTEDGIQIDSGNPITQTSERIPKSTKNSFTARSETDPSSISIDPIPLASNADSWIAVTEAGIEIQVNERHVKNAHWSIPASLDRRSNATD